MRRGEILMLGERLIKLRKARKLTQQQVADKLHISRGTYAQYEIDRRVPEYSTLEKMADFFEVSIDFLVGRSDEPKKDLSEDAKNLLRALELTEEDLIDQYNIAVDGIKLSPEHIKDFIAYVRIARAKDK